MEGEQTFIQKHIFLKESMELNWDFQRGGEEFKVKNVPWEGCGYVWVQCMGNQMATSEIKKQ